MHARDSLHPSHAVSGATSQRSPLAAVRKAVENGASVNEVEGAGCTPLHNAAWCGWLEVRGYALSVRRAAVGQVCPTPSAQSCPWLTSTSDP